MKVETSGERVLLIAENEEEITALAKLVGPGSVTVRAWNNTELILAKAEVPKPTKDEEHASIVARYHQTLMREGIRDWDIAARLTEKFQDQLLADYFGKKNGSICH